MTTLNVKSPNGTQKNVDLDKIVTGVKGNSESTYRTGDVNITAANVGALASDGTAAAATKLATARTIDGVDFNGTADITHYGTCSTAAGTAAKTVACTSYKLVTGSRIVVKFTVTNTAANPTLNVNSTGAKAIQYRGSAIGAGNLAANRTYEFVYDGTNYQLVGDLDTNTQTVTGVKGDSESTYRTGNVNLTAANVGAAASNHNHDSTYLKLSGGTLSGMLNIGGTAINMGSSHTDPKGRLYNMNGDTLRITGGSSTSDGSYIDLYNSTNGNGFKIDVKNSSNSIALIGKPDGTLTWDGKHIVRSMSVQGGSEGYQTFSTNIAIEWGTANFNGAKYVNVTLPLSLVGVYGAYGVDAVSESSTALQNSNGTIAWAYGNNTTSNGLVTKIRFISDVTNVAVFKYFVIGRI